MRQAIADRDDAGPSLPGGAPELLPVDRAERGRLGVGAATEWGAVMALSTRFGVLPTH